MVLRAEGEPTFFHPGDAYDAEPGEVDVLAVPLNAPWAASRDTIAFVRRIAPRVAVPVHDALLSEVGRGLYLSHVKNFGPEGMDLRDLYGGDVHRDLTSAADAGRPLVSVRPCRRGQGGRH